MPHEKFFLHTDILYTYIFVNFFSFAPLLATVKKTFHMTK